MKEGNSHEIAKIFYCFSKFIKAGFPKDLGCLICKDKGYCRDLGDVMEKWLVDLGKVKDASPST